MKQEVDERGMTSSPIVAPSPYPKLGSKRNSFSMRSGGTKRKPER